MNVMKNILINHDELKVEKQEFMIVVNVFLSGKEYFLGEYMIISDLYQTKIEVTQGTTGDSYYNVDIDSTAALVTVTLLDFNGNPVKDKNVTLTVDKGYFTQKGTSAGSTYTFISASNSKSITVATGDNGKIHGVFTASEWGLATFSANSTKIQINVTGWRDMTSTLNSSLQQYCTFKVNEALKLAYLCYSRSSWSVNKGSDSTSNIGIPSQYCPTQAISQPVGTGFIYLTEEGKLTFTIPSYGTNYSTAVNRTFTYHYE